MITRLFLLSLLFVLLPYQVFSQDDAPLATPEDTSITHEVTPKARVESKTYMLGMSYSFRDNLDKFWFHNSMPVKKTGWIGTTMSISSLMMLVMAGPDGEPRYGEGHHVTSSTTGGIGFFGNCGIKFGQASLITSAGVEFLIKEEQLEGASGFQWNAVGKVLGRPVGIVGFRIPFISRSDLELGYKTTGTTFVSLLLPFK
jgi:hypothetical protein